MKHLLRGFLVVILTAMTSLVMAATAPEKLYLWGIDNQWLANEAIEMNKSGNTFYVDRYFDSNQVVYFNFVTQLGDTPDDYSKINDNRYSPVREGYLVKLGEKQTYTFGAESSSSWGLIPSPGITYRFTMDFDTETLMVTTTFENPESLYLVGTFNNWDITNAPQLAKDGNKFSYKMNFTTGVQEFKLMAANNWESTNYGPIYIGEDDYTTIVFDDSRAISPGNNLPNIKIEVLVAGEYELVVDCDTKTLTVISGVEVPEHLYLVGSMWYTGYDPMEGVDIPLVGSRRTMELPLLAGTYEFCLAEKLAELGDDMETFNQTRYSPTTPDELVVNGQWMPIQKGGDSSWKLIVERKSNCKFTFDHIANQLKIDIDPLVPDFLYVVGDLSPNGWDPTKGYELTAKGSIFNANLYLGVGDKYFALGSALGDWEVFNASRYGAEAPDLLMETKTEYKMVAGSQNSWKYTVPKAGYYTLRVNFEIPCVNVYPTNLYLVGKMNEWNVQNPIIMEQTINGYYWEGTMNYGTENAFKLSVNHTGEWNDFNAGAYAVNYQFPLTSGVPETLITGSEANIYMPVEDGTYSILVDYDFQYVTVTKLSAPTGITDFTPSATDAPVYYNLNGLKIDKPVKGVNIVKRGNKSMKVVY